MRGGELAIPTRRPEEAMSPIPEPMVERLPFSRYPFAGLIQAGAVEDQGIPMPINEESRSKLLLFVAHVALLQSAVHRNATSEQIHARLAQIEADAAALAQVLATDDPALAEAVREAWQEPARATARGATGALRS